MPAPTSTVCECRRTLNLLTSDVRTVQIAVQEQLPRALRREYPGLAVSRPSPGPRPPDDVRPGSGRASSSTADSGGGATRDPIGGRKDTGVTQVRAPSAHGRSHRADTTKFRGHEGRRVPRQGGASGPLRLRSTGGTQTRTTAAVDATRRLTGAAPRSIEFPRLPSKVLEQWNERLAHQVADPGTPERAAQSVQKALRELESAP